MTRVAPKGHRFVLTNDGTFTLFSEAFEENCHSTSGAKEETIVHYIKGCEVVEKSLVYNPLNILEVGFGMGVGFLTTLEQLPSKSRWNFVSLEQDQNLLDWFRASHPELKLEWTENVLWTENDYYQLSIILGDARQTVPDFLKKNSLHFHCIYQDAFSPKKNPTLWTREWFELIKKYSHPEATLSTYSSSISIRKSLMEAGWGVHKGERFGIKRTSTRAVLNKTTDTDILLQLQNSPIKSLRDGEI